MENKIVFSDVLSTDDIDFLIGSCMRPTTIENWHMEMKNEKNVGFNSHMDYSISDLPTHVYERRDIRNVGIKSEDAIPFVESTVDFDRNDSFRNGCQDSADVMPFSEEQAQFHRNSADPYINDSYKNCTASMQPNLEIKSHPINQELPSQSKQPMRIKPRRFRTAFTAHQMFTLEREYQSVQYLNKIRRVELATSIGLNEQTVKTWFQNRRMKAKREEKKQKSQKHRQTTASNYPSIKFDRNCPSIKSDTYCPSIKSDTNCPSIKPYGDFLWSIYPHNCAMQMQQQYQHSYHTIPYHHGMADVKQTVPRW